MYIPSSFLLNVSKKIGIYNKNTVMKDNSIAPTAEYESNTTNKTIILRKFTIHRHRLEHVKNTNTNNRPISKTI